VSAKPNATATADVLDYLTRQVQHLGDDYTGKVLTDVADAHGSGTLATSAALRLVAALLAHEDPGAAERAVRYASRRMAVAALVSELDIEFGRGVPVALDAAHERLREADPGLPRARVADALRRRHLRDTGQPFHGKDGQP
jgi:hypothetical protein